MRRSLLVLLALLEACSPRPLPPPQCGRRLIDNLGSSTGSFATFVAPPLSVVNTPQRFTVFAPLSGCADDALVVNATLLDADNQLLLLGTTPAFLDGASAVSTTVSFELPAPGQYTLRVAFEPSLGVREFILDAVSSGLDGATTRVPIPGGESCYSSRVWPLSDDTVACEDRFTGRIALTSADGGLTTFLGANLVVVDTVLWSVEPSTEVLERRVWEDGGLRRLDGIAQMSPALVAGMHDVELALRMGASGRLTRTRVLPDGGSAALQYSTSLDRNGFIYFSEQDDLMYRGGFTVCEPGQCVAVPHLVGLEPGFVWRVGELGDSRLGPRVSAYPRPLGEQPGLPVFTLRYEAEQPRVPDAPFERLPLWLQDKVGTMKVMVSATADGHFEFTAWPADEVLKVGRHHVVLSDPEVGFVRVVKR